MSNKTIEAIRQLEVMINLTHYSAYIGRKTKYGDRPHQKDVWGHTRKYLTSFPSEATFDEVKALFESVGCDSEIEAAQWIVVNDKHITQDF